MLLSLAPCSPILNLGRRIDIWVLTVIFVLFNSSHPSRPLRSTNHSLFYLSLGAARLRQRLQNAHRVMTLTDQILFCLLPMRVVLPLVNVAVGKVNLTDIVLATMLG